MVGFRCSLAGSHVVHLHPIAAQGDQPVTVVTSSRDKDHSVLRASQLRNIQEVKKIVGSV